MTRRFGDRQAPAVRRHVLRHGVALLLAALLAACGGSGSSGFDGIAAENAAIDRALSEDACTVEGGLTICPSGGVPPPPTVGPSATPTPSGSPAPIMTATITPLATPTTTRAPGSPTPTFTRTPTAVPAAPAVAIEIDGADASDCAMTDLSQPCLLPVQFLAANLPPDATLAAAARQRDPDGEWLLLPVVAGMTVVPVPAGATTVQVASLLYLAPPGELPAVVRLLADSGADTAFVAAPIALRAPP